jgi:hypothetical protein
MMLPQFFIIESSFAHYSKKGDKIKNRGDSSNAMVSMQSR